MHVRSLSLAFVLGFVPAAVAQKPIAADMTIRSHAILTKHCAGCHGDKRVRSDLKVLDHTQMVKNRPVAFIQPKNPTASQVLELIEEGSMPPGKCAKVPEQEVAVLRDWVASGAAAYPVRFDDEFAHETILANIKDPTTDPDDVPFYRYLTLHHLAEGPAADLTAVRPKFLEAVRSAFKKGSVGPRPIDPTATVFRIDLRDVGWDHKPFIKLDPEGREDGSAKGNIFDILLLEYPHAVLPAGSPVFAELVPKFLRPADQVRPVAFVRGDWFADAVTASKLTGDLRKLIAIAAEIPAAPKEPNSKLAGSVKAPDGAIPAIDAWHGPDLAGEPTVKGFKAETIDFSRDMPRDKFYPDERFRVRISATDPMFYQVIYIDAKGKIDRRFDVEKYTPGKPREVILPPEGGLSDEELGPERILVFAAPTNFAPAEGWREKITGIERIYHPFFDLKAAAAVGAGSPDAKVMRKSLVTTVLDPKTKK